MSSSSSLLSSSMSSSSSSSMSSSSLISSSLSSLPDFIQGYLNNSSYGISKLNEINSIGKRSEFISKNYKYKCRQTFALCIGYDGQQYYGYQRQKNFNGLTVEEDILKILKLLTTCAGRTDRGVSAISQIINFNTNNMNMTPDDIYNLFKQSIPYLHGRLTIYDCQRVPKKFHSRASATWRRYLYMFPLNRLTSINKNNNNNNNNVNNNDNNINNINNNINNKQKYDVDVEYLNIILSKIENKDLPYNAFAFKEDRVQGEVFEYFYIHNIWFLTDISIYFFIFF